MKKISLTAALVLGAVLFGSCLDFFTNSLGTDLRRDPGTITVTSTNVTALLKESRGDPEASRGILDKIAAQLKNNPNPDPTLQAAAVTAANQGAGLGELVLGNISTVLENDDKDGDINDVKFNDLLKEVEIEAKKNDIKGVSDQVTASLKAAVTTDGSGVPALKPEFTAGVSDSDLLLLGLTLVMAEAEKGGGVNDYLESWGTGGKTLDATDTTSWSDSERLIAAIGNQLSTTDTEIGKALKDLLGGD
ncbi:MAG: hypothetical protein LBF95_06325 [Treponema sp.]|nr:hypothetical protein [Treponema sp.]